MAEERFTLQRAGFPLELAVWASTSVERTTTRLPAAIVAASRSLAAQLHRLTTVPRAFKPSKTGMPTHPNPSPSEELQGVSKGIWLHLIIASPLMFMGISYYQAGVDMSILNLAC
uniref:Uncharacterized protein n=1 Tax=Coccidioides posadasii RMSCC 3488 TaxID=454284 RepID=A0A0J6F6K8_COCPO|nr:hypothetical protein CPAG_02151 [Coccidioides posadasii RMSCC 3488]